MRARSLCCFVLLRERPLSTDPLTRRLPPPPSAPEELPSGALRPPRDTAPSGGGRARQQSKAQLRAEDRILTGPSSSAVAGAAARSGGPSNAGCCALERDVRRFNARPRPRRPVALRRRTRAEGGRTRPPAKPPGVAGACRAPRPGTRRKVPSAAAPKTPQRPWQPRKSGLFCVSGDGSIRSGGCRVDCKVSDGGGGRGSGTQKANPGAPAAQHHCLPAPRGIRHPVGHRWGP